jgi:hypothetical protein
MPGVQRNFNYSAYLSDDGTTYALKADQDWINAAASGAASPSGHPAYGRATRRRHPRYAVYRDATTFRTFKAPVFTPTAYAALTPGTSTITLNVPGLATGVSYQLVSRIAEQIPSTIIGRQLSDHA